MVAGVKGFSTAACTCLFPPIERQHLIATSEVPQQGSNNHTARGTLQFLDPLEVMIRWMQHIIKISSQNLLRTFTNFAPRKLTT